MRSLALNTNGFRIPRDQFAEHQNKQNTSLVTVSSVVVTHINCPDTLTASITLLATNMQPPETTPYLQQSTDMALAGDCRKSRGKLGSVRPHIASDRLEFWYLSESHDLSG